MTASALLMLLHAGEVELGSRAIAFAAIDLIGYLPGARAFRRAGGAPIAPIYHHLYNVTHNFLTAAVVTAVWALARRRARVGDAGDAAAPGGRPRDLRQRLQAARAPVRAPTAGASPAEAAR